MEHVITAPHGGIVRGVTMAAGDVVREGFPIVFVQEAEVAGGAVAAAEELDLDHIRDDLRESYRAPRARPWTRTGRRRWPGGARTGYRMPRENIDRLVDPGSFNEYWPLVVARQHQRHRWRRCARTRRRDGVVAGMAFDQRQPVRRDPLARRRGALRLHGARRHAGTPQSLQAGPDVRAGAPLPPAGGPVRRGRRRPAGRGLYRPARRDRHAHLHDLLAAERAGAAGRYRQRPHLRRQHRACRAAAT